MRLDLPGHWFLVADGSGKAVLIDHRGVQFVVASGGLLGGLRGVTVARDGQVLVLSQSTGLIRIDPTTGAQANSVSSLVQPGGIAVVPEMPVVVQFTSDIPSPGPASSGC